MEDCYTPIGKMLDGVQSMLDGLGWIPPAGWIFDLMSASISSLRGNGKHAAYSMISLVPFAGDIVGKGMKYAESNPELAQSLLTAWQMNQINSAARAAAEAKTNE